MLHSLLITSLLITAFAPGPATDDPAPSDPVFLAELADGTAFEARIRAMNADGHLEFILDSGGERPVALGEIYKLGRKNLPSTPPRSREGLLLISGGDRISSRLSQFDDEFAWASSEALGDLRVPLEFVVGSVFETGLDGRALEAHVRDLLGTTRETDETWLTNGDRLSGSIAELTAEMIVVDQEQGPVTLDRGQVRAIALDPALIGPVRTNRPRLELYLSDRSRITGNPTGVEGGRIILETGFGPLVRVPIDQVVLAYVLGGSTAFLTDSEPAGAQYVEYIGPVLPFRVDRSALGGPLRVGGFTYERGIGTQSRTLLAYRLDGSANHFRAMVALDDAAGPWASVAFKILLDGQLAYESPVMKSGDKPIPIDLPLGQARLLILSTDFGTNGNVQDYADWIEVRLVK
jgi:hypothetical protein